MAGLRIHHPTIKDAVYIVVDESRKYGHPLLCVRCNEAHQYKTYHVNVDADGYAMVAPTVWERLQSVPDHGFTLENEVTNPPAQTLGWDMSKRTERLVRRDAGELHEIVREFAPKGVIPRITTRND